MTRAGFSQLWIEAARFELERRQATYPRLIRDRKIDEDWAQVDFQCWSTIVEWLESGRARMLGGWAGFAEPPQTVMTWALLEQHAKAGLDSIEAKLKRETDRGAELEQAIEREGDEARRQPMVDQLTRLIDDLEALRSRREGVWCIHHVLVQQRELADTTQRLVDRARAEIRAAKAPAASAA